MSSYLYDMISAYNAGSSAAMQKLSLSCSSSGLVLSGLMSACKDSHLAQIDNISDVIWVLFQQACTSRVVLTQLAQDRLWASQSGHSSCQHGHC